MNNDILYNRKIARIVTAVLIVASFLGGGVKSINRLKTSATDIFYNGATGDGFGIERDIGHKIEFTFNMITVASRYIPDDNAVKQLESARSDLINSKSIADKSKNNLRLNESATALYDRLGQENLSESDAKYRENIYTDIKARNNMIMNDGYNKEAREFNRKLDVFPASLIKSLRLVSELPLF